MAYWNDSMLARKKGGLAVQDVFSTNLYTGNAGTQAIVNGINLLGEGGLVWVKQRNGTQYHSLVDTERTAAFLQRTPSTAGDLAFGSQYFQFKSDGFYLSGNTDVNASTNQNASWTFRKAPKFFDIVTYTGDGANTRAIPHSLGVTPGMVIVKCRTTTGNWSVRHKDLASGFPLHLNTSDASGTTATYTSGYVSGFTDTTFTTSGFSNNVTKVNQSGYTYVAYLFAHDPSPEGLIQCGSYVGKGSVAGPIVDLGWEPQYLLIKNATATSDWYIYDTTRGFTLNIDNVLLANTTNAEISVDRITPTPSGFMPFNTTINTSGQTYIYMAIRAPEPDPVSAKIRKSFSAWPYTGTGATQTIPNGIDLANDGGMSWYKSRNTSGGHWIFDTLRGDYRLSSDAINAQAVADWIDPTPTGVTVKDTANINVNDTTYASWTFKKQPRFFDVVTYTGDGVAGRQITHNLGVAPGMVVVKASSTSSSWLVQHRSLPLSSGSPTYLYLNRTDAGISTNANLTWPTPATESVFTTSTNTNFNGYTYVAYLFAHDPAPDGIIQCGSYVGNGATDGINVELGWEPQYVLLKSATAADNWLIYDSSRAFNIAGPDGFLMANSAQGETTNLDSIKPTATGFIPRAAQVSHNNNGQTYIYMAIRKPTS